MHLFGLVMNTTKNGPDGHLAEIRAKYIRSIQLSFFNVLHPEVLDTYLQ